MKLWLLSQKQTLGYDVFNKCVVAAETEKLARSTLPDVSCSFTDPPRSRAWASNPKFVTAKFIGFAAPETPAGVILASFNAG